MVAGSNLMLTGNNSTGWSGKLGGIRSGRFSGLGYWGVWWSSTEDTITNQFVDNPYTNAKLTVTAKGSNSLSISSEEKYNGYSVRCLRD